MSLPFSIGGEWCNIGDQLNDVEGNYRCGIKVSCPISEYAEIREVIIGLLFQHRETSLCHDSPGASVMRLAGTAASLVENNEFWS